MQTLLHGKYKKRCDSIFDELEDEPDIKNINRDLETLAEPAKIS